MKKLKTTLLILTILLNSVLASGCWNYVEIEKLATVAGVAIDKGINEQYQMTVEIITISGGKDSKMSPEIISAEGKTIFDAARNIISISGKKLYWSHAKVIILSKEIASNTIAKVLDWYNRDSETRPDVYIMISKEPTAKEIFNAHPEIENIMSLTLVDVMRTQVKLSKSPDSTLFKYDIESQLKEISSVIPTIGLKKSDSKTASEIMGAAIIRKQTLTGFLNPEETKTLFFIRNEIKGGVLTGDIEDGNTSIAYTLEIFNNKTKVKPVVKGKNVKINIDINTKVSIDEIEGTIKLTEANKNKLEQIAENKLKREIEELIKKVQSEYDADIFNFGSKLHEDNYKKWKSVKNSWDEIFKNLKPNVNVKVTIKNSALLSKTLKEGD